MAQRTFTAQEQAKINQRYPGIEWVNGRPYTRQPTMSGDTASTAADGTPLDYLGNPVTETGTELVPSHTDPGGFPWEFVLAQMLAPGVAAGIGALAGAGGASAAAGGGSAAAGAPAGMLAPASIAAGAPAAGGAAAAGGGAAAGGAGAGGGSFLSALGGWQGAASNAGRMFGQAAEASANSQAERAQLEQQRNNLTGSLYNTQQNAQMNQGQLDLQRKGFDESSEGSRMRRALIGQLLGNAQNLDIDIPGIPKANITGGLSMNSLGQGGRDMGAEMTARALERLRAGNTYQGGEMVAPPEIAPVGKLGGNKFLNVLAGAGSLIGGMPAKNQPATRPGVWTST